MVQVARGGEDGEGVSCEGGGERPREMMEHREVIRFKENDAKC